jgi:hypothetical protein
MKTALKTFFCLFLVGLFVLAVEPFPLTAGTLPQVTLPPQAMKPPQAPTLPAEVLKTFPKAFSCRCGPSCTCTAGECGDPNCPSLTRDRNFKDAMACAVERHVPLVIWVNKRQAALERSMPEYEHVHVKAYPGAYAPGVVLGVSDGNGGLVRAADLPGAPQGPEIKKALEAPSCPSCSSCTPTYYVPTFTPAFYPSFTPSFGGCGYGGCAPSFGGCGSFGGGCSGGSCGGGGCGG